MSILHQDRSEINFLFVHSEVDDYGLSAQEFRVYAHLARRAGGGEAWPSVDSMAAKCRLHRDTVYQCLKHLKALNLVRAVKRPGTTTIYTLTPRSQWKAHSEGVSETKGYPSVSDTPCRKARDTQVSERKGHEGNPLEGTPWKENTAARLPEASNEASTSPAQSTGRPPDGGSAMSEKSPQSSLQRKAYAIAERLERLHWDNCKVAFAKHAARACAEGALRDGHDERAILQAYDAALRYCHGVVTDEICRGERGQSEKASPALTVWLARERLKGDPRTVEERWQTVVARLTAENRNAIEEEARIRQEIAEQAPGIEAWFAHERDHGGAMTDFASSHSAESQTVTAENLLPSPARLHRRSNVAEARCRAATACRPAGFRLEALQPLDRGPLAAPQPRPSPCASSAATGHASALPLPADHAPNPCSPTP